MNSMKLFAVATLLSVGAMAQNVIPLQPGQSIQASQLRIGDTVTCGYQQQPGPGPGFPGGPGPLPPPPPPPGPQCDLNSVNNGINSASNSIRNLASGKCGYRVDRCKDNLEDHAVADSQRAAYNDLASIRDNLERQCGMRNCDPHAVRLASRDFDNLVAEASRAQMTYKEDSSEVRHQAPILTNTNGLRARCF